MFYKDESLSLFVDGPNIHATARALNFEVDYKRLREAFLTRGRLLRANYFATVPDSDDHLAIRPLLDWMQYNGWNVVTKPVKFFEADDGRKHLKGNCGIEMAVEAMKQAPNVAHAVLFTGNGDFTSLVYALQERNTRVTVVSTLRAEPPMISNDLRRAADEFIDLDDLRDAIARPVHDGALA